MKICGLIAIISISAISARAIDAFNLTSPSALELPTSIHCNASASWLPENTSVDDVYPDCYQATLEFLRTVDGFGRKTFEFHAAGVQPSRWPFLPSKTTPLKYTHKSCVILVTNLHNLPLRWLPLFAQQAYPATDAASFHDVFEAVDGIMTSCMESLRMQRRLGWAVQGQSAAFGAGRGLGVFLFGKGSDFDRAVPALNELGDDDSDRERYAQVGS